MVEVFGRTRVRYMVILVAPSVGFGVVLHMKNENDNVEECHINNFG